MLLELGLPSFNTLIINGRVNLTRQLHSSNNSVIRQLRQTLGLHVIKIIFIDFMWVFLYFQCVNICPLFYLLINFIHQAVDKYNETNTGK